jgi:integrase/recombinase XerD
MADGAIASTAIAPSNPAHVTAQRPIEQYLALAGHALDISGWIAHLIPPRSIITSCEIWLETGIGAEVNGRCVHSLRATAATNALSHEADIAEVQEWLGHANVSTTRLYDRRKHARRTVRRSA